ncbi:MAG TPA: hypothetical protein VIJ14_05320 [Rhabdochlamydiaceae bacterium]
MKKIAICMSLLLGQVWGLSCTTPVTLSESGRNVTTPKVAINEEGEVLTVWVSKNPENKEETLFAATRDGEKKWSSAVLSEPVADIYLRDPYIDAQGNQFVFWEVEKENEEGDELEYYQFTKKEKNQAWTPAVNVSNPEDKLKYPKVAFDSQRNVLLLSHAEDKDPKDIWSRTKYTIVSHLYSHQKGEVKKTEIAQKEGYSSSQHLVKNRTGKVFAWWEDRTYKGNESEKLLKGSWLLDDGSWSTPATLFSFSDSYYLSRMKGAMNSKGDLAMLWIKSLSGHETIQAATCIDGQWSEPLDIAVSDDFSLLNVKMNDAGHIAACWANKEKGKDVVYVADKPIGQSWSSPIAVSNSTKDANSCKMSMDEQGNILMIWIFSEGRKEVPYAAYKPVNQEWGASVRLSNGTQGCSGLKVESNHQGSFVVLWNEIQRKQISIHGAALSTATKEWTSATLSTPGQDCGKFKFAFNKKGQGIIAWETTWDFEDSFIQVAELNVN